MTPRGKSTGRMLEDDLRREERKEDFVTVLETAINDPRRSGVKVTVTVLAIQKALERIVNQAKAIRRYQQRESLVYSLLPGEGQDQPKPGQTVDARELYKIMTGGR